MSSFSTLKYDFSANVLDSESSFETFVSAKSDRDQPSPFKRTAEQPDVPTNEPLRKRPRRADSAHFRSDFCGNTCNDGTSSVVQSKAFWHADGDVVFKIEDVVFKLYRSHLASQSHLFAATFAELRRTEDDSDRFDNSPMYYIERVSASDFEALLGAMQNAITYAYNQPKFTTIAAILRAAHTLRFPAFRTWAAIALERIWSDDLTTFTLTPPADAHGCLAPNDAIATITLARDYNLPRVLKRAYFEVLRLSFAADALPRETIALAPRDLVRILALREHLSHAWLDVTDAPPALPNARACFTSSHDDGSDADGEQSDEDEQRSQRSLARACARYVPRDERIAAWSTYMRSIRQKYLRDPLSGLHALEAESELGLCEGCAVALKEGWGKERGRLWAAMDVWLGLAEEGKGSEKMCE